MAPSKAPPNPPSWRVERSGKDAMLRLSGDWIVRETGLRDDTTLRAILGQTEGAVRLCINASGLGRWDSALVVFLVALRQAGTVVLDETGLPPPAQRLLALMRDGPMTTAPAGVPRFPSVLTRIGAGTYAAWDEAASAAELLGEMVLRGGAALVGRARTRATDVLLLMRDAGAGALGIVTLVNFLVGAILAFAGAVQLRRFGAGPLVVDLVSIVVVREMAAMMTAIIMAGRTGGAYAAQIAAMQSNEEIDALRAIGIPVPDYLVLPRVIALIAMMPMLYIYGCAAALLGGLLVTLMTLHISASSWLEEMRWAVTFTQLGIGFSKSLVFGALVALCGCHIGLKAGRSAAEVGHAATSAVVAGIIGVIAADGIFAVCADALGI